jgi:Kef-type K+ transport system membrane component KefB
VNNPQLLSIGVAVLVAAIAGKEIACWLAARLNGETNRTALAVGTLMNARGLMELIIVNIGLQKGIIQPALFSILVMMAIVTTLMTSPLFELVYRRKASESADAETATVRA